MRRKISVLERIGDLPSAADLVRPRLDALLREFSEEQYPKFRGKLSREKESVRVATRELEWDLNQRVYGYRPTKP